MAGLGCAVSFAATSWKNFSRPVTFHSAATLNGALFLGTDGGVRAIYKDGGTQVYTPADGLSASEIYGVRKSAANELYAVSSTGIVAKLLSSGSFSVINRSFTEKGIPLIPDLLEIKDSIMVLGFTDRLAFLNVATGKAVISITRIGDVSLTRYAVSAMAIKGDSLFVAMDSLIYVRRMQWANMAGDLYLADPDSWSFVREAPWSVHSLGFRGDSLVVRKAAGTLTYDSLLKETSACESASCPVMLSGKELPDSVLADGDTSRVRWIFNENGYAYLVGTDSAWIYRGSKPVSVAAWTAYQMKNVYNAVPLAGGGIVALSEDGPLARSDGDGWAEPADWFAGSGYAPYFGSVGNNLLELNVSAALPDGKMLVATWGLGWSLYENYGGSLMKVITVDAAGCLADMYVNNYAVSRGVIAAPDSSGFLVTYWGSSKYGIAYIDASGEVSCANDVGSGIYSGPIRATYSSDGSSWIIYSSVGAQQSFDGNGSLDVITMTPPSETGGEIKNIDVKTYPTMNDAYLVAMDLDATGRLWAVSASAPGYWDTGMDSMQTPLKISGYQNASLSSLQIDAQGRLWIGTLNKGAYMLSFTGKSPDTLTARNFTMQSGMLSDIVYNLGIDPVKGHIWFIHGDGISRYARTDLRNASGYMESGAPAVKVYPNPFLPKQMSAVIFENISEDASVLIYNAGGHLVRSFRGSDLLGGRLEWDGRDRSGNLVAPGVYHYFVVKGSKKKTGKLLIVH